MSAYLDVKAIVNKMRITIFNQPSIKWWFYWPSLLQKLDSRRVLVGTVASKTHLESRCWEQNTSRIQMLRRFDWHVVMYTVLVFEAHAKSGRGAFEDGQARNEDLQSETCQRVIMVCQHEEATIFVVCCNNGGGAQFASIDWAYTPDLELLGYFTSVRL